jgi:hypothetical protein
MPVHTLDTSALSELAKPGSALVRHRLVAEVDAGRIVVLVTWPLMWELVGARSADDAHYRAMVEVLLRVTVGRVMLSERSRRERELRARGALTITGFVDDAHCFVPAFDPEAVDLAAAKSAGLARGLRFAEAEQAEDTVEGLNESVRMEAMARGEDVDEVEGAWHRALALANRREEYALELAESYARDRMLAPHLGRRLPATSPACGLDDDRKPHKCPLGCRRECLRQHRVHGNQGLACAVRPRRAVRVLQKQTQCRRFSTAGAALDEGTIPYID